MGVYGTWLLAHAKLVKWAGLSSTATIAADMPLAYMISSEQPTDRTRFTDASSPLVFDVDLAAGMAAQGIEEWRIFALLYNNSSSTGTFRVVGASSAAGIGSPTYDSGELLLWPSPDCGSFPRIHSRIWEPDGQTETYLRVTIDDPTPRKPSVSDPSEFAVATYFDIGCLLVSDGYRTEEANGGVLYASPIDGLDQESRQVEAEGGPDFARIRHQKKTRTFDLIFSGDNAAAEYYAGMAEFRSYVGNARAIFLAEDLLAETFQMHRMVYGLMTLNDVSIPANNRFQVQIRIRELL